MIINQWKKLLTEPSNRLYLIQQRFKSKKGKHSSQIRKDPTQSALAHFDKYHRPVYGDAWSSVRLALLSPHKYGALVNNYSDVQETITNLASEGAEDIIKIARQTETSSRGKQANVDSTGMPKENLDIISNEEGQIVSVHAADPDSDLYHFMPTKKVGSAIEQLKIEEAEQNINYNLDSETGTRMIADDELNLPEHLKVFAFERGDTTRFSHPRLDKSGKMDCYMYDAASVLPVVALDLQPNSNVLDLCSGPGGKTLTMLQTMLPESVTCVEPSYSRMKRLREVVKQYIPGGRGLGDIVTTVIKNGVSYCQTLEGSTPHDRVLVDVPCLTDRHVLHENDNNLFKGGRLEERVHLPKLQAQLLFHGIQACQPGGIIVYSTCTLSPLQNDGVVQAVLERLWQETNTDVAVVDTSHIADRFRNTFTFFGDCRFGQLVIPHLTANFGPMYICKLKRLN